MSTEIGTATVSVRAAIVNPRLRILELPMQHAGEWSDTPFVFVLDRAEAREEPIPENFGEMTKSLGAVGALIFATEIDLE